ncbi:MAG: hypothetical protein AAGH41_13075 [Pseudomonadota bacterium]
MFALIAVLAASIQTTALEQSFLSCAEIRNDKRRLECYDATASTIQRTAKERAEEKAEKAVSQFGIAQPKPEVVPLERLELKVASAELNSSGYLVLTFENGQVWRQVGSTGTPFRRAQFKKMKSATIIARARGPHRIEVEPLGRGFKARRVQ